MTESKQPEGASPYTRREFMRSAGGGLGAAGLTGMGLGGLGLGGLANLAADFPIFAQEPAEESPAELAIAIIGPGSQGKNLLTKCLKIPGVRFVAATEPWEYHQRYAKNVLKKYGQQINLYTDYRDMLAKEPVLDAVIIATPDWVHAEQTNDCLAAGKHVYCEKEMSNTIEGARSMVVKARETGKLLQIGHQRRSNPRYWHALKLIEKDKVLGRISHIYGQWNRPTLLERDWPRKKYLIDEPTLQSWGYDSMDHFRNWRWYRKYSGGAMADLGSHQLDVFSWFLRSNPKSVLASGGLDYFTGKGREWYDNVIAIYEWDTPAGPVRGSYQVLNTTSHGGFYETFMGDQGSMIVSEDPRKGHMFRELSAKRREWEDESETVEKLGKDAIELKIGQTLAPDGSPDPEGQRLLAESKKPEHQLHLENFFKAVRANDATLLTCPPEVAFETAVTVLKANEAVAQGKRIDFKPEDFVA